MRSFLDNDLDPQYEPARRPQWSPVTRVDFNVKPARKQRITITSDMVVKGKNKNLPEPTSAAKRLFDKGLLCDFCYGVTSKAKRVAPVHNYHVGGRCEVTVSRDGRDQRCACIAKARRGK